MPENTEKILALVQRFCAGFFFVFLRALSVLSGENAFRVMSENVQQHTRTSAIIAEYGTGLASVFAGSAVARSALRRQVFHRRDEQRRVLPLDLSGADGQREELSLLSDGGCGGGSGIPSVPALPAGVFAGNAGVAGHVEHGGAGAAIDWRERSGRRRRGGAGGAAGRGIAASAAAVSAASGRDAHRRRQHAASALREEVDRRDAAADGAGRAVGRIRLRAALQCGDSDDVPANADADSADCAAEVVAAGGSVSVSAALSAAVSLEGNAGVSRAARDARRRGGGVWPLSAFDLDEWARGVVRGFAR